MNELLIKSKTTFELKSEKSLNFFEIHSPGINKYSFLFLIKNKIKRTNRIALIDLSTEEQKKSIEALIFWRRYFSFEPEVFYGKEKVFKAYKWQLSYFNIIYISMVLLYVLILLTFLFTYNFLYFSSFIITLILFEYVLRYNLKSKLITADSIPHHHFLNEKKHIKTRGQQLMGDMLLGSKNTPNTRGSEEISIKCLNYVHKWEWQHNNVGQRIVPGAKDAGQNISVIGCSITYGYGVNDDQTFCAKLQEKYPDVKFSNHGVNAYSMLQMYLTAERVIKSGDLPNTLIVGFHTNLEERNTNAFSGRLQRTLRWKNPQVLFKQNKLKFYKPRSYRLLLGSSKFHLIKLIEYALNRYRFSGNNSKNKRIINQKILLNLKSLCHENDIKLLIACVDDSEAYYQFFIRNNFNWCIGGVKRSEKDEYGRKFRTNYPLENHPNTESHQIIADNISIALGEIIKTGRCSPKFWQFNYESKDVSSVPDDTYTLF